MQNYLGIMTTHAESPYREFGVGVTTMQDSPPSFYSDPEYALNTERRDTTRLPNRESCNSGDGRRRPAFALGPAIARVEIAGAESVKSCVLPSGRNACVYATS